MSTITKTAKSVSLGRIDAAKVNNKDAHIGLMLCEAGETLGAYTVMAQQDSTTCLEAMTVSLKLAMADGLSVDMLKAGRAAYVALVDSFQYVREANGMPPLSNATRDNYLSRIRNFVRDRGANPLDVFGNLKAMEQRKAKKEAAPVAAPSSKTELLSQTIAKKEDSTELNGIAPLQNFLTAWTAANDGNAALLQLRTLAGDLLRIVNATAKK
ncbi:MAG: hypothetical protein ACYC1K_03585 [Minisyncoccota bacterium]